MAKHRSYSVEFKRQVAQEYLAGETLHGLAKRPRDRENSLYFPWVSGNPPTESGSLIFQPRSTPVTTCTHWPF